MTGTRRSDKSSHKKIREFRGQLLEWYDRHGRDLPWRAKDGTAANPYHVWLSEIMLQQTTVRAVHDYFIKFIDKWPDIHALAAAGQEEVMQAWAGLGYYARARNLHSCARVVSRELAGVFPKNQQGLRQLPGIGEYTSAAMAAILYNEPATVVDGNIERVTARFFAVTEPLPAAKATLKRQASAFFKDYTERPGDLAQALMDLGAAICIPKAPRCGLCPVSAHCMGKKAGNAALLPQKSSPGEKPQKFGYVYWIQDKQGRVLVHRRPQKGLLGGMACLPTTAWEERSKKRPRPNTLFPAAANPGGKKAMRIRHSFTHFDLELELKTLRDHPQIDPPSDGYFWSDVDQMAEIGLPTVFEKARRLFMENC
jgi:A/G-specific adenine glycosylase